MKVRLLICFLLGTAIPFTLQAQDNVVYSISPTEFQRNFAAFSEAPSLQSTMNELAYNEEKYRKFKKMRTTGMVLTGVGAGLITTGIVLIASGADDTSFDASGGTVYINDMTPGDGKVIGGVVCLVFGIMSTGGGITLWAIGNNKMKRYDNAVNLQSTKNGLVLAYSF
ncbi:MAG: hypothetical protein KIT80_04810 [Chitinophagaceae bacterium]|nr:hypothetical protein [Chitinophagaceae bacterium]MCW5926213.1 hypothetical protein [Chitinophagaceae bacterium]